VQTCKQRRKKEKQTKQNNNEFHKTKNISPKQQIEKKIQAREQSEKQALMKTIFIEMKAPCNTIVAQCCFKP
jgi:hypothetical protein